MEPVRFFPGVYFDTVVQAPQEVLPRMDIAAFVGFSSSGPLHTPVAVEDITRFRDIFGNDVPLAWNSEKQLLERSYLGPTVEAFFRNGGQRCWIVRVADEAAAWTHRFPLPGAVRIDASGAREAEAWARCPGSWAADFRIGTVLQVTQLQVEDRNTQDTQDGIVFNVNSDQWFVDLKTPPGQFVRGDLLQMSLGGDRPVLFGFIDTIAAQRNGTRLAGVNGFWYFADADLNPLLPDPIPADPAIYRFYRLSDTDGLGAAVSWPGGSPLERPPRIRLLRFEILAWQTGVLAHRFSNLAFSPNHPRFWGGLPTDAALFRQTSGRSAPNISMEKAAFLEQAKRPRLPFAGPQADYDRWLEPGNFDDDGIFYLPVEMSLLTERDLSLGPRGGYSPSELIRDGLGNYHSGLFLDELLYWANTGALQNEAENQTYLRDPPVALRGIHSLFAIDEITLVAVPDAIHRRWNQIAQPFPDPLPAPWLKAVAEAETKEHYLLRWSQVAGATGYIVEYDTSYDFDAPTVVQVRGEAMPRVGEPADLLPEPDTFLELAVVSQCMQIYYFRVRTERSGQVSTWSNTRTRVIPDSEFLSCEKPIPVGLGLKLKLEEISSPPEVMRLTWEPADYPGQLPEKADEFELEQSGDDEFGSAQRIYCGIDHQLEIEEEPDAIHYFRVRAWYDQVAGPWSNIRRITPKSLSQMTLQPLKEYTPYDLLAVQRALLRLCAARGDLFAVLSVPHHFRHEDVVEYLSAIIPASRGRTAGAAAVQAEYGLNVPALTLGEQSALGYAALYHPWLAVQTQLSAIDMTAVRLLPPDGPVIGRMARRTLDQGAWFAPANDPLVDVVALEPGIDRDQWAQLLQTQVNVVRQTSSGFLLLSADTLSLSRELRSINVRRLLILLRRLALREGNSYIFESNDESFRDRVRARFERFLSDLYSRGAFAGDTADSAYRVVADSSVNLPQNIDLGRFIVELQVAPSEPLKFLKVRLIQTEPNQLQIQEV